MSIAALPLVNMGIGAATTAISAVGQWKQGTAEQAAYNYNAEAALEEMRQQEAASEQKFSALMGKQRSLYAKAGVDIASGSPIMVLANTAMQAREEQQRIQSAGEREAGLQKYYGRMARYSSKVGAMTTFLTGLGKTATDLYSWAKENKPQWFQKVPK